MNAPINLLHSALFYASSFLGRPFGREIYPAANRRSFLFCRFTNYFTCFWLNLKLSSISRFVSPAAFLMISARSSIFVYFLVVPKPPVVVSFLQQEVSCFLLSVIQDTGHQPGCFGEIIPLPGLLKIEAVHIKIQRMRHYIRVVCNVAQTIAVRHASRSMYDGHYYATVVRNNLHNIGNHCRSGGAARICRNKWHIRVLKI